MKGKKGGGTPEARERNEEAMLEGSEATDVRREEQDAEAIREEKEAIPDEEDKERVCVRTKEPEEKWFEGECWDYAREAGRPQLLRAMAPAVTGRCAGNGTRRALEVMTNISHFKAYSELKEQPSAKSDALESEKDIRANSSRKVDDVEPTRRLQRVSKRPTRITPETQTG
ncbi:hypothetical protein NDU88_002265 [Pleurodeles waltl]|uniref:Uncharacterized protein n=1 Tax=Pleurodeles waltl TaxID=8319 RepID=A0AAV7R9M0_PLEWA|nr:hypothetical protein NDU88_002265 [Pleurodeles waltl]